MKISFSLEDSSFGSVNILFNGSQFTLFYPCSSKSFCTNYITTLPSGIYIFETWGGSGGLSSGHGGYSVGTIHLTTRTIVRIYVGSEGDFLNRSSGLINPSFNGGGGGYSTHSDSQVSSYRSAGSGGGATDIRINGNTLYDRIIVAGGGGGGTMYGDSENGLVSGTEGCFGKGENQTYPGIGDFEFNSIMLGSFSGIFGHGGQGQRTNTYSGGGWFGGGSSRTACSPGGGGGGSGYILNFTSFKPYGYMVNSPKYYLSDSHLASGDMNFSSCYGDQLIEEGHLGYGCARITAIFYSEDSCLSYPSVHSLNFTPLILISFIHILTNQNI